jgi:hypothetical protein
MAEQPGQNCHAWTARTGLSGHDIQEKIVRREQQHITGRILGIGQEEQLLLG